MTGAVRSRPVSRNIIFDRIAMIMDTYYLQFVKNFLIGMKFAGVAGLLVGCSATMELPMAPESYAHRMGSVPAEDVALAKSYMGPSHQGYWWDPAAPVSGSARVVVNLPAQKVFVYKGDSLIGASKVSTGREGHNTPSGKYSVLSKHRDHRSNLYGDYVENGTERVVKAHIDVRKDKKPANSYYRGSLMPYFTRLRHHATGATSMGFHEGYLPGYAASHGCLRLPGYFARKLFEGVPIGSTVIVENAAEATDEPGVKYTVATAPSRRGPTGGYLTQWGMHNRPVQLPSRENPPPQIRPTRSTSGNAVSVPTGQSL